MSDTPIRLRATIAIPVREPKGKGIHGLTMPSGGNVKLTHTEQTLVKSAARICDISVHAFKRQAIVNLAMAVVEGELNHEVDSGTGTREERTTGTGD